MDGMVLMVQCACWWSERHATSQETVEEDVAPAGCDIVRSQSGAVVISGSGILGPGCELRRS